MVYKNVLKSSRVLFCMIPLLKDILFIEMLCENLPQKLLLPCDLLYLCTQVYQTGQSVSFVQRTKGKRLYCIHRSLKNSYNA